MAGDFFLSRVLKQYVVLGLLLNPSEKSGNPEELLEMRNLARHASKTGQCLGIVVQQQNCPTERGTGGRGMPGPALVAVDLESLL